MGVCNDDGTTDPASLEKSKSFARYASFPAIPPTDRGVTAYKSASPWYLTFDDREESTVHKYDISTTWGWNTGTPITYPTLGQKKGKTFSPYLILLKSIWNLWDIKSNIRT